jgi:hypothetical protein
MNELTFEPFPKLARLRRTCTITEKIDGTNAQIVFGADGELLVGSRKRAIYPEGTQFNAQGEVIKGTDNFGFAAWVYANRDELFEFLGEGRHYGEWAGVGIQRGYHLDHKRFFLFNSARFGPGRQEIPPSLRAKGLDVVPVLYEGEFTTDTVDNCMESLWATGSHVVSRLGHGHDPEGVVVYHHALRSYFKVTYDYDDGKWRHGLKGGDA